MSRSLRFTASSTSSLPNKLHSHLPTTPLPKFGPWPLIAMAIAATIFATPVALADSSSPRLAAYYERKMLVCGSTAYQWRSTEKPRPVATDVTQVGVGRETSYALTRAGVIIGWQDRPQDQQPLLDQVRWFAAGRSGLLAIRTDHTLWHVARDTQLFGNGKFAPPVKIADQVMTASVGDSADYYVTRNGSLFVKGLAHRGQYGDGKLQSTDHFIPVVADVIAVKAHTGHAIHLTKGGAVMGTGGNIFGPVGRHGIGDKATTWGKLFDQAVSIATGSSHTVAIKEDGSLWAWGRNIGLDPTMVLQSVIAAAADRSGIIALKNDGSLWQWDRGQPPQQHFRCR